MSLGVAGKATNCSVLEYNIPQTHAPTTGYQHANNVSSSHDPAEMGFKITLYRNDPQQPNSPNILFALNPSTTILLSRHSPLTQQAARVTVSVLDGASQPLDPKHLPLLSFSLSCFRSRYGGPSGLGAAMPPAAGGGQTCSISSRLLVGEKVMLAGVSDPPPDVGESLVQATGAQVSDAEGGACFLLYTPLSREQRSPLLSMLSCFWGFLRRRGWLSSRTSIQVLSHLL